MINLGISHRFDYFRDFLSLSVQADVVTDFKLWLISKYVFEIIRNQSALKTYLPFWASLLMP